MDGNGRVGRLLIALLLVADGVLKGPLLYLSLYLKQNRNDYYDHLQGSAPKGGGRRGAATASRVHDLASRFVVFRPTIAAEALGFSAPPVYNAVYRLEEAGILREVTGRQREAICL